MVSYGYFPLFKSGIGPGPYSARNRDLNFFDSEAGIPY